MATSSKHIIVGTFICFLLIAGVASMSFSFHRKFRSVSPPKEIKYGLVYDLGSVHSSVFLYSWPIIKKKIGLVTAEQKCKVKGLGIYSFADDPPKAGESLRPCLDTMLTLIPKEKHSKTIMFVGARAGMRLLRKKNAAKAKALIKEITKTIRKYPFIFKRAQIISGKKEGIYEWIQSNYIADLFLKYSKEGVGMKPNNPRTYGTLNLGEASTQITFIPNEPISNKNTKARFQVFGTDYIVYTHSHLCFGKEESEKRILATLLKGQDLTSLIEVPCYLKGYATTVTLDSIYGSPCTSFKKPSPYDKTLNVTLVGTGNSGECRESVKAIFNFAKSRGRKTCSFNRVYQPPVNGQFFAFSAFYNIANFFDLILKEASLETTMKTIEAYCNKSWKQVLAENPKQPELRLKNYCTDGWFLVTLLVDGYKFDHSTWNNISFQKRILNHEMGWTLGYMLHASRMTKKMF